MKTQFRLFVVDTTGDREGWEHNCSAALAAAAENSGFIVERECTSEHVDFAHCFANRQYDALLLFSHGNAGSDTQTADVTSGSEVVTWSLYANSPDVRDKVVFVVVCSGFKPSLDMLREQTPRAIVGFDDTISCQQARSFFEPLFDSLAEAGLGKQMVEAFAKTYAEEQGLPLNILIPL